MGIMRISLAIALLFIIVLSGCTQIGDFTPGVVRQDSVQRIVCGIPIEERGRVSLDTDWFQLTGLALMASVFVLAVVYLFGNLFRNQNLLNAVKFELSEVFVTVLLIAAVKVLTVAVCSISVYDALPIPSTTTDIGINPDSGVYEAVENYFLAVGEKLGGWMGTNYGVNIWIDQLASVTPYSRPLGVGLVATPLAGLASPLKQMIYNVMIAEAVAFIINSAQLFVFQFGTVGFLLYYLPIGVFLRSFTPTRRIGGTLIALSLVFLFFYPFLILLTSEIVFSPNSVIISFSENLDEFGRVSPLRIGVDEDCLDPDGEPIDCGTRDKYEERTFTGFIKKITIGLFSWLGDVFGFLSGGVLTAAFMIPISTVGMAFAVGYLFPAFNTLMFVQAAKHLSKTIGEEIDITALTRLI